MEPDRFIRTPVSVKADLTINGTTFSGVTENVSGGGICMVTSTEQRDMTSLTKREATISLKPSSEEAIVLKGRIVWIHQDDSFGDGRVSKIGFEITDTSPHFDVYIMHLSKQKLSG